MNEDMFMINNQWMKYMHMINNQWKKYMLMINMNEDMFPINNQWMKISLWSIINNQEYVYLYLQANESRICIG